MLQRQCIQQQQQQLLSLQQLLPVQQQLQPEAQPDPSTSLKRSAQCIEEDSNGGANKIQKTTSRWSPTQSQLQALEVLFSTGQGTPSKPRIKDITEQLLEFGPITEPNVYNCESRGKYACQTRTTCVTTVLDCPIGKCRNLTLVSDKASVILRGQARAKRRQTQPTGGGEEGPLQQEHSATSTGAGVQLCPRIHSPEPPVWSSLGKLPWDVPPRKCSRSFCDNIKCGACCPAILIPRLLCFETFGPMH
eukprot:1179739-Prorocentrum_minimum.AAC.2